MVAAGRGGLRGSRMLAGGVDCSCKRAKGQVREEEEEG